MEDGITEENKEEIKIEPKEEYYEPQVREWYTTKKEG